MSAKAQHWAIKWQASKESNDSPWYKEMIRCEELKKRYEIQLKKQQETNTEKKLENLCDDINVLTKNYLANRYSFLISPARYQSIERLVNYSKETQKKPITPGNKLNNICSYLLKELNDTEKSHNKNPFSRQFTKSKLAGTYMSIFEQNGVNPNNRALVKNANEFKTDEEDTWFSCFPKLI